MTFELRKWLTRPLRIHDTALPPALVLIAKLVTVMMILQGVRPFPRYLPFIEGLDLLGPAETYEATLRAVSICGFVLVLGTRYVRAGAFLVGSSMLISFLGYRPTVSVAHTYAACVMLMISLSSRHSGTRLLRWQVVVLYAGALTNKLFDPDWWNGSYFDSWMIDRHAHPVYMWMAQQLPDGFLSTSMGIATLVLQASIVICFLRREWVGTAMCLGVLFHGMQLVMLDSTFGPFTVTALASYLAFLDWPDRITVRAPLRSGLARLARLTNFDGRYRVEVEQDGAPTTVGIFGKVYAGWSARLRFAFYDPTLLLCATALFTLGSGKPRTVIATAIVLLFVPCLFAPARAEDEEAGRIVAAASSA